MPKSFLILIGAGILSFLAGCQCCSTSEKYGNLVDDLSDHSFCMDRVYRPELDLTRIGSEEWCRSRWNRFWCDLVGGRECRSCEHAAYTTQSDYPVESPAYEEWIEAPEMVEP